MAMVWKKQLSGVLYEVRSAGKTLRLYTDGVFHSQYNPDRPVTGHVWDLLMLPAFFYSEYDIKRVLVMGVAGGAVLHLLRQFTTVEKIVGVELNSQHVSIGRRFFNLQAAPIELVEADAIDWLKSYQGEPFDMIIDDLFAEEEGEPVAVVKADTSWFSYMLKHLTDQGVIVRNFINKRELLESAGLKHGATRRQFKSVFQFTSQFNENFVAAYLRKTASSRMLRSRLVKIPGLNPQLKTSRLRYKVRQLI